MLPPRSPTVRQVRSAACPAKLDDGWTIAAPDSVGLDGARLCTIEQRLKLTDSDIHAVVIARHGKLAFEQYFAGIDQPWGKPEGRYDYDATALHDMRSATKSVTSLLVGIAIDRRMIKSVNTRIVNFFPAVRGFEDAGLGECQAAPSPDHVVRDQVGRGAAVERSQQ